MTHFFRRTSSIRIACIIKFIWGVQKSYVEGNLVPVIAKLSKVAAFIVDLTFGLYAKKMWNKKRICKIKGVTDLHTDADS